MNQPGKNIPADRIGAKWKLQRSPFLPERRLEEGIAKLLVGKMGRDKIGKYSDDDNGYEKEEADDCSSILTEISLEFLEQGNPANFSGV